MKNAIIKVVAVAAMVFTFAFSWVSSSAYALNLPGLNQLAIIKVTNLREGNLSQNYLAFEALREARAPLPPIPLPSKLNEDKKYGYIATPLYAEFEQNIVKQLNERNSAIGFPERYEYIEGGLDKLESLN
ncbi:hypothetical protein [Brasilonema bromeliae]|uniref:PS II complex 12 kDa extrinsic protein n=1 Tax=Brasilonema bromeliae SPC951 TaxID=385972 RepID=A0ABX1PD66_9CYAN|nr:hypothetical protein [Brasilonema bromeliae]NMG22422.1 hypothetical protein [Brasilonema bromeliae SPC951]